jgi:hypothetical protein
MVLADAGIRLMACAPEVSKAAPIRSALTRGNVTAETVAAIEAKLADEVEKDLSLATYSRLPALATAQVRTGRYEAAIATGVLYAAERFNVVQRHLERAKAIIWDERFAEAERLMNKVRAVQSVDQKAVAWAVTAVRFATACTDGVKRPHEPVLPRPVWALPAPAIDARYLAAVMKRLAHHQPVLVRGLYAELGTKESLAAMTPPPNQNVDSVIVDALAQSPELVTSWIAADDAPKRLHAVWAVARQRLVSARSALERRLPIERDPAVTIAIHWALAELGQQ